MLGDLSNRTKALLVVGIIFLISMLSISAENELERSDISPILPINYFDTRYDGHIVIDDVEDYNFDLSSEMVAEFESDTGTYCCISLRISPDRFSDKTTITYNYYSEGNSMIPSDAIRTESDGLQLYEYTDPYTGDELLFNVKGENIISIGFNGRSVINGEGGRSFIDFDLDVFYESNPRYVQNPNLPKEGDWIYEVTGMENTSPISGNITLKSESRVQHYGDGGTLASYISHRSLIINIEDSTVGDYFQGFVFSSEESKVSNAIDTKGRIYYLNENTLTTKTFSISAYPNGDLSFSGVITIETLNNECDTVDIQKKEFEYKGVMS